MGIIGNIYGAARFKFVSGTAMFRGERAKIMMLNNDALSLARVVQYALTINPTTKDGVTPRRLPIAAAAMAHIIDRPNIHAKAVPEIAKYLNHPYFEIIEETVLLGPVKYYSVRLEAQELLKQIGESSPNLSQEIEQILRKAPEAKI